MMPIGQISIQMPQRVQASLSTVIGWSMDNRQKNSTIR
jgi:hypothetical protein